MRVLVADDEPLVREEIAEFLELSGCEVRTAEDGRKALMVAADWQPQVVFLDVLMPEMDGIDLTRALKSRDPKARIVAMSGGGRIKQLDILEFAKRYGADYTITKPVTHQKLFEAISAIAGRAKGTTPAAADDAKQPG